jgi:hypothetical protein
MKSPLSATIRTGEGVKGDEIIKNAVDFVVLDHIFRNSTKWEHLKVSDSAVRAGRRAVSIAISEGKGSKKKVSYSSSYVGYKLSEITGKYVSHSLAKSPESDSFTKLILTLITKTIPNPLPEGYEIPKSFFEVPSITVRKCLRQGPKIASKKGLKENLYAPFSFVKSSECNLMPIDAKKAATDLSTEILSSVDQINKMDASKASTELEAYKRYLDFTYLVSDLSRDKWRKNYSVPDYHEIRDFINEVCLSDATGKVIMPLRIDTERISTMRANSRNLVFVPVPTNKAEEDAIKNDITSAENKRKRSGTTRV